MNFTWLSYHWRFGWGCSVLILFLINLLPAPWLFAQAQPMTQPTLPNSEPKLLTPQATLERLFTASTIQADWFSPTFLAQVPVSQIEPIIAQLQSALGTYQETQQLGTDYLIIFERGSVPTKLVLDANGRITGLLFQPPRSNIVSLDEVVEELKTLPGKVSFLVLQGNSERAALNTDEPLAVGSAFKLTVLEALQEQINSGQRSWSDVVALQSKWKSLPSGILQNWPDGSQITLETLASLMISQSDNTATDALIHIIGREAVERKTSLNRPFLTTREAFILKNPKNAELLNRYRTGDETQRRAILNDLERYPLPTVTDFSLEPYALDVEWFFTARELCRSIENVANHPLMSINPGVANADDWDRVAYKGGSEAGVLNLTTWLKAKNGQTYCVTATWNNDAPLDETRFLALYNSAIAGLKE